MAFGLQIFDSSGNFQLDVGDLTFRYRASYSYTADGTNDVLISAPGAVPGRWFAISMTPNTGFPVVETDQIRIKRAFFGGGIASTVHLFSL
jgi:hypothetical protein